jgi:hypothetical protein
MSINQVVFQHREPVFDRIKGFSLMNSFGVRVETGLLIVGAQYRLGDGMSVIEEFRFHFFNWTLAKTPFSLSLSKAEQSRSRFDRLSANGFLEFYENLPKSSL